jgi:hypothetical protein
METWTAVAAQDQIIWDTIMEFPDSSINSLYRPYLAVYHGGLLPYGQLYYDWNGSTKQFSASFADNPNGATWHALATNYGVGPNGGFLWRFVTSCVVPDALSAASAFAYLLRTTAPGSPARTVYIHNHVAYRLAANQGRLYGDLPFTMVAAGQTPVLSNEDISFPGVLAGSTLLARVDLRNRPLNFKDARVFAIGENDLYTPLYLDTDKFYRHPPSALFGSIADQVQTLAVVTATDYTQAAYVNGSLVNTVTTPMDNPGAVSTLRIGQLNSATKTSPLMPFRRLQVFDRMLPAAEVAQAHNMIVAAEA